MTTLTERDLSGVFKHLKELTLSAEEANPKETIKFIWNDTSASDWDDISLSIYPDTHTEPPVMSTPLGLKKHPSPKLYEPPDKEEEVEPRFKCPAYFDYTDGLGNKHTLYVQKRTYWKRGRMWFYKLILRDDAIPTKHCPKEWLSERTMLALLERTRKIEAAAEHGEMQRPDYSRFDAALTMAYPKATKGVM